jgi:hypothetical protein
MKKNKFIVLLIFLLFGFNAMGQLSTKELPVSFSLEKAIQLSDEQSIKYLSALDMEAIRKEDEEREGRGDPPRFGYKHKVDYNLDNSGTWTTLPNGDKIWHLEIFCPKALSINLLYDKFWLPEGAKFFVFNSSDKKYHIGAFTSKNNKGTADNPRGFATGLVYGDKVTLEYFLPKAVAETGVISIAYVVHGYRYINLPAVADNTAASGSCQVNVNCSEGQNWQNEKNAVALILVDGSAYCSGSLINTTANDGRPLFLTANHCICKKGYDALGDSIMDNYSFYWNYESPTCTPTSYPTTLSTSGAVVVANNGSTDFALLRLTEDPKFDPDITTYYLGWDRTGNSGTGGVGIHHPAGDVKKIATHNISPANSDCMNFTNTCNSYVSNSSFWKINWMKTTHGHSVTEGGSSGSPLFDNNHRVIGQLFGAGNTGICPNPNCSNPSADIANYGKISVSWNNSTDPKRRLSNWLDPNNTGVTVLNGLCATVIFTNQTVSTNTTVTSCGDINVQNVTVTNNAKLTLDASNETVINGEFEVTSGSELEIK